MIVKKETLYRFLKKATNNTSITRVSLIPTCSKIFKRIIYKLKQNGIKEKLLCYLIDFLRNRQQRSALSGQSSSWTKVNAGVAQRSILGPLLFLVYINVLLNGLRSNPKLFADDTFLFSTVQDNKHCQSEQ